MTDDTVPVVDADIVSTDTPPSSDGASVVLELENLIKSNIAAIDRNKSELKKLREMVMSALTNSEPYREAETKSKDAAKEKSKIKQGILQDPANKQLVSKTLEMATEVKEAEGALSDYLREYARLTGTNEIETDDGEVREITYTAKLIKKSSRFS